MSPARDNLRSFLPESVASRKGSRQADRLYDSRQYGDIEKQRVVALIIVLNANIISKENGPRTRRDKETRGNSKEKRDIPATTETSRLFKNYEIARGA